MPEIVLAVSGLLILAAGVFPKRDTFFPSSMAVVGALLLAGVLVLGQQDGTAFGGQYVSDSFSGFMKLLVVLGGALGLLLALDWNEKEGLGRFEFSVLVLYATLGGMVMVSANDLMTTYLGLELLSLPLYVIAAFHRDDARSAEAGLKYFVLGALASGLLLYGASLIYGFAGTTNFGRIAEALTASGQQASPGLVVGIVFVIAALAFKVSAVPFHMWTPDVYEGAPTPVTAFFAMAPKVAAVGLLARVLLGPFGDVAAQWQQVMLLVSMGSMLLGAFAAIGQRNIKRLMAYSSIGHIGYALIGLAANSETGTQSVLVYLAIYLAMTVGTFACILSMRTAEGPVEDIESLAGLAKTNLSMAFVLAMLLFSMAGIPPLAGFFAKLYVFGAAIKANLITLAVIGVLASVVGAYYYLRLVKIMFFDEAKVAYLPVDRATGAVMALSGAFVLLYVLAPAPLGNAALTAARALHVATTAAIP
jgi:NADH-quinone oxidoreductase subunit N